MIPESYHLCMTKKTCTHKLAHPIAALILELQCLDKDVLNIPNEDLQTLFQACIAYFVTSHVTDYLILLIGMCKLHHEPTGLAVHHPSCRSQERQRSH